MKWDDEILPTAEEGSTGIINSYQIILNNLE